MYYLVWLLLIFFICLTTNRAIATNATFATKFSLSIYILKLNISSNSGVTICKLYFVVVSQFHSLKTQSKLPPTSVQKR